ncbi:MAG: signal peptidase I [Lachnospiraceae bacterium]|nr:signal peptidase I [Lachnospiraceae bacterium]
MLTYTKRNTKKVAESFVIGVLLLLVVHIFFELSYVSGESMAPTFENGDILLVKKWAAPHNGDIVTAYIEELDYIVVKRVIGMEGDHILVTSHAMYRNEELLQEFSDDKEDDNKVYETIVPEGHVFLMGDNWAHSLDSRSFGCIPIEAVRGVVLEK